MPFFIYYFIAPLGVFLFFAFMQKLLDMRHEPYLEKEDEEDGAVIVSLYQRGRAFGSYSQYCFLPKGASWKYKIDKQSAILWVIEDIIVYACMFFMFTAEGPFSTLFMVRAFLLVTEAMVCMAVFFPLWAYYFLMKNVR